MTTQPTDSGRREPRVMLALIALATDLPVPDTIQLYPSGILCLQFDRLAEALAWSAHLGGDTRIYAYRGRRYLSEGVIEWHGWRVQLHASEPIEDASLDTDTTAALTALTDA